MCFFEAATPSEAPPCSCLQKAKLIGLQRGRTGRQFRTLCRGGLQGARTDRQAPARPMAASLKPQAGSPGPHIGLFLRRFRGAATFQSLLRTNIFRKQLSRSCCWSRRASSCKFRVANLTMEANAMRLCRRLCPAARFSRLLPSKTTSLPPKGPLAAYAGLLAAYLDLQAGP